MAQKDPVLRDMIYTRYQSEAELSRRLGWTRQRLNTITNGYREPNLIELSDLSKELEQPVKTLVDIFLRMKSPNRQQYNSSA